MMIQKKATIRIFIQCLVPFLMVGLIGCGDSSSSPKKNSTATKSTTKTKATTTADGTDATTAGTGAATTPAVTVGTQSTAGGMGTMAGANGMAGMNGLGGLPTGATAATGAAGFPAIPNGQGGMEINNYWNLLTGTDKDAFMKCITGNGAVVAGTNKPLTETCITQASNSVQGRLLGPILQMYGGGALPPGGLGGYTPTSFSGTGTTTPTSGAVP